MESQPSISICSSLLEELCMREPCTILKHSCLGLKKLGVNLKMDYDAQNIDITPALEYLSITLTVGKSGYNHKACTFCMINMCFINVCCLLFLQVFLFGTQKLPSTSIHVFIKIQRRRQRTDDIPKRQSFNLGL
jgi:hypothetical protein